eukprot:36587-Chlamydomonas_euryale.AAC.1
MPTLQRLAMTAPRSSALPPSNTTRSNTPYVPERDVRQHHCRVEARFSAQTLRRLRTDSAHTSHRIHKDSAHILHRLSTY